MRGFYIQIQHYKSYGIPTTGLMWSPFRHGFNGSLGVTRVQAVTALKAGLKKLDLRIN